MKNVLIIVLAILVFAGAGFFIRGKFTKNEFKETNPQSVNSGAVTGTIAPQNVLNLSGQGLTKVPMYVFDRTSVEELNLSKNSLTGALQSQVGQLKNLKVLNLSNNRFTGVPAEVGQLRNLEILDLSNNELTGLPNEIGNLSKLKLLDVSGNNYSEADLSSIRKNLPSSTVIKTR